MGAVAWRIRKKWNDARMIMVQKSAKNEINGVGCISMISSFASYMPLGNLWGEGLISVTI